MLKDGLYELFYRAARSPDGNYQSMLLVLRAGRVLAADPWGGVCMGRVVRNKTSRTYRINVRMLVPAGGMLVTDDTPRTESTEIEIGAEIGDPADGIGQVEIAGQAVNIAFKYQGPIPG